MQQRKRIILQVALAVVAIALAIALPRLMRGRAVPPPAPTPAPQIATPEPPKPLELVDAGTERAAGPETALRDWVDPAAKAAAEAAAKAAALRAKARDAFARGLDAQRRNDNDAAIAAYRDALDADATLAGAWTNLALALDAAGQRTDAVAVARRATEQPAMADPARRAHAFHALGHVADRAGLLDDARRAYEEALRADAKKAATAVALGDVLVKAGKPDEALAAMLAAKEAGAASAALETNIAVLELRAGHADAAAAHAADALRIDRDFPEAKLALGYALLGQRKWGDAAQRLDEAGRQFKGDADIQVALGYAYQRLGRREDAMAAFDRALAIEAKHPQAHAFRGMTLEEMGQAAQALEEYRAAIGADAKAQALSASKTKLAVAAYKEKRLADARALAQEAVAADPRNAHARYVLGLSAFEQGDRKAASEQEYALTRLDTDRAAALRQLLGEKPAKKE